MKNENIIWRNALLSSKAIIKDAIRVLDEVALKIVLITDDSNVLIGTVSDGDIRRGLLNGLTLNSPIESIINKKPVVVSSKLHREKVLQIMNTRKIQQIPIVNEKHQVTGLHIWNELTSPPNFSNEIIIMAGGKGTRMLPKTLDCPKPMLPVSGKPILEHIINSAKNQGFNNFVLAINYLGHMIQNYFGDGSSFGVKIQYLHETSPLGTVGALSLLDPTPRTSFIVTNGDVLTDINFADLLNFHQLNKADATVVIKNYAWQNPFGVVQTKGIKIIGFEEKPIINSFINAGVYVLDPSTLKFLKKSEPCDMPTLLNKLKEETLNLVAYPIHEPWIDIGSPDGLENASR
ncbi:MAG: nucleotidyltransferase family protein [Candidatus Nanopelagicales bacterium]